MNQKPLILAVGILAGAAVVYFLPKAAKSPVVEAVATAPEPPAPDPAPAAPPAPTPPPVREAVAPRTLVPQAAPATVSAWSRLAEKYGAEKTALSSKITSNLTSVITQGLELANTAARNSGSGSIGEAVSKEALRSAAGQLGLTEEQKKQASGVIQSAVERRMTAVTDLTSAMTSEPEQIMGLMLAGDALARKEISQEQYDQLTQPTRAMLQNLAGFVGGRPGAGGVDQLLGDAETTAQLNAILTPEQQTKLAEMTAKMTQEVQTRMNTRTNGGMPFQFGQIPVMELDRLDQSVASVRQMTDAAKLMMEAMKGLKDANSGSTNRSN